MIPLALVTGFLGSGKTTFLQHLVGQHRDRRLVYLVNEFATVDVDGVLLDLPAGQMVSVPGGSIFCRCLVTEFVQHLRSIAARPAPPEGVIIEASGIADPRVVTRLLAETRLDQQFTLANVISIVDPDTLEDLLETLPTIRAQIEAAALVIINKIDLHAVTTIDETEQRVRELNPDARILRATNCAVDIDLFKSTPKDSVDGEYALCADPNYCQLRIESPDDLDLTRLATALEPLRHVAYRIKGFVRVDGQSTYVDVSRTGITTRPAAQSDAVGELVCIYPPTAVERMKALAGEFEAGRFSRRP